MSPEEHLAKTKNQFPGIWRDGREAKSACGKQGCAQCRTRNPLTTPPPPPQEKGSEKTACSHCSIVFSMELARSCGS